MVYLVYQIYSFYLLEIIIMISLFFKILTVFNRYIHETA
jgi:hypothetical protein